MWPAAQASGRLIPEREGGLLSKLRPFDRSIKWSVGDESV